MVARVFTGTPTVIVIPVAFRQLLPSIRRGHIVIERDAASEKVGRLEPAELFTLEHSANVKAGF
jgi:hypothetical protein